MNHSNGRMWDEHDKAISRITDLEEELEKAIDGAEKAKARAKRLQAVLERWLNAWDCDIIGAMANGNVCFGVDEGIELSAGVMARLITSTKELLLSAASERKDGEE